MTLKALILLLLPLSMAAQNTMQLTLWESIKMAQDFSPEARAAEHTYRAAYWSYRA